MTRVPLAATGDVDRNGDLVSTADFGPGTPLLALVTTPPEEAAVHHPGAAASQIATTESNDQLRARVRRARELHGPRKLRWPERDRRAFRLLAERGLTC